MRHLEPLQVGVIGAGYWGRKVAREVMNVSRATGTARLYSVSDNSPTALEECQQEFGPLCYQLDYKTLLSDNELSAVHICTPNPTHYEVASSFLKAGKSVLVEKPLAVNSKEAYELVRLAGQKKLVLSAGHVHRFNNGVRELKRAISTGFLGKIYYLRIRWAGLMPPQQWRDVITDLAPHPFDISNYLTNQWPTKISCRGKGYRTRENEEVAFISCEYEDGLAAHIEVSWQDPEKRRKLTIVAKEGIASLDCLDQKAILQQRDHTEQVPIKPSNTLREEISHFANCINHNGHSESFSNDSDGLLGAHVVTCLEAARDSLIQERTVKVQFPLFTEISSRR